MGRERGSAPYIELVERRLCGSAEIEIKIDVHMFEFIAPSLCAETGEYTDGFGAPQLG